MMEFNEDGLLSATAAARVLTELLPRRVTTSMIAGYVYRGKLATHPPIRYRGSVRYRIGDVRDLVMAARVSKPSVDKHCARCGVPIQVRAYANTERNYCGSECYHSATRERAAAARAERPPSVALSRKGANRKRAEAGAEDVGSRRAGRPRKNAVVDKVCGKCGAPIVVYAALAKRFNYCDRECFHAHRFERAGLKEAPSCETCGVAVGRQRRYCSRECFQVTRRTGETLITLTCLECGDEFVRPLQRTSSKARKSDKAYCGMTCRNRALAKTPRRSLAKPLGAKKTLKSGYVWIKTEDGWKNEHRVVMAKLIGRPLLQAETVHHKSGNRADNRPSNLELWNISQPSGQRVEDKLTWALELIQQYGPDWTPPNRDAA